MAMSVKEVTDWLNEISDLNHVAVDDGGLALVEVESWDGDEYCNYLEIGGVPEKQEEEDHENG